MWIITKTAGVINARHVTRFTENNYGTHAYCYGSAYMLSNNHVLDQILTAIKQGLSFLEVE